MENPLIKSDGTSIHILCPKCGVFESVELPCSAENLIPILNIFTELHKHK